MPLKRIPTYPYPRGLHSIGDISKYLESLHRALQNEASMRLSDFQGLDDTESPTFTGLTLSGLTASQPVVTNASKLLSSQAYAAFLASLSGQASGAFDWNGQNLTNMGTGHDVFTDFVAAEHVSLPNTIASVLSNHSLAAHTTLGLFDASSDVDHDQTTNFVANEHVDWTPYIDQDSKVVKTSYKARAYRNADQLNLVNNTWTKVQLNAESYDPGALFDSTTNYRFTAPAAGYYLIVGQIYFYNLVADKRYRAALYVNNAAVATTSIHASYNDYLSVLVSDIRLLAATDYVELFALTNAGVDTVDIFGEASGIATYLSIHLLSV